MNNVIILILALLGTLSDLLELTYELGTVTRKYAVPAMVYCYVVTERYVVPAFRIPQNYLYVRRMRLAEVG